MGKYQYFDVGTMASYLQNSVVRNLEGEPSVAFHIGSGTTRKSVWISYYKLESPSSYYYGPKDGGLIELESDLNATGLDLSPIPMGLFQADGQFASLVHRLPQRQWKTGITKNNVKFKSVSNPYGAFPVGSKALDMKGFHDLLRGRFAPRGRSETKLREATDHYQTVINRKWFITSDDELFFYQFPRKKVGSWKDGYTLIEKYQYLQQELDKMLNETQNT